jgi:hypothetical protein
MISTSPPQPVRVPPIEVEKAITLPGVNRGAQMTANQKIEIFPFELHGFTLLAGCFAFVLRASVEVDESSRLAALCALVACNSDIGSSFVYHGYA